MLCIYFSFSVQCTLTLLLQLKQTPTDSSYKPSFKKKDRRGMEKQRYKPYGYSAKFRGDRCSYGVDFFPAIAYGLPDNAIFLILLFFVSYLKARNVFFKCGVYPCTKYEFVLAIQYF